MILLSGKELALQETKNLEKITSLIKRRLKLVIIQVGNLEESNRYINHKIKKAHEIGIYTEWIKFNVETGEESLVKEIKKCNKKYDGIIVQLPLPDHLNKQRVLDVILPENDIDGLTTTNGLNFYRGTPPYFIPATANAIYMLLDYYKIKLKDQKILVIGESNLVGRPIKNILSNYSNYVDSTNKEKGISHANQYDILIVAAGIPHLIKEQHVKENAIVIDVGITIENNKIIGDVDFDSVKHKALAISPVPGGVGPLTVISLLKNLVDKFK